MIVALAAAMGVPLWLIAFFLWRLLSTRANVRSRSDGFTCKFRIVDAQAEPSAVEQFPRFASVGRWVHDVCVIHGGNPFLTKMTVVGVRERLGDPQPTSAEGRLRKFDQPTLMRFRLDGGEVAEVVCSEGELPKALGPFDAD